MEKIIEYTLETLNRENGGAKFENLATDLAEKEICSNIIPSTGPYGGGDKGVDAKTHDTKYLYESGDTYRLFQSPLSVPAKEKTIFAYSINKDWKNKLKKDLEKIIKTYKLKPKIVAFMTNQSIKEKAKANYIIELNKIYPKVKIEVYDLTWFTLKLKDRHYPLMTKYFGLPETENPEIVEMYSRIYAFREGGMTDKESVEVKEALERAHYRSSYNGVFEKRVLDLKKAADIQKRYPKFIEESIKNYEEALTEIEHVVDKTLGADLYYAYFQTLQKGRYFDRISSKISEYRDYLFKNRVIQHFKYLFSWSMYLLPHTDDIKSLDVNSFVKKSYALIEKFKLPQKLPRHIVAEYDEAIIYGKQTLRLTQNKEEDVLALWSGHIDKYKDIPLYPIVVVGKVITGLAMFFEGDSKYEDLYSKIEGVLLSRNEKLAAAQLRRDRALNLYNVGKYAEAIHHANIVKIKWYDHDTLRGSLLTSFFLKECYSKLGLKYAAIYELLTTLHISTLDEALFAAHRDLFVTALAQLYFAYLTLGLVSTAIVWGRLAFWASKKYDIEPDGTPEGKEFVDIFGGNTSLLLNDIRVDMPVLHQKIFDLMDPLGISAIGGYKMLVFESDEEFVKGWEGKEKDLEGAKDLRERMRSNEIPKSKTPGVEDIIEESKEKQVRSFEYMGVKYTIDFGNNFEEKLLAEHILSFIQDLVLETFIDERLTWVEDKVIIHIKLDEDQPRFVFQENANNEAVDLTLRISKKTIESFYKSPFEYIWDFETLLLSGILLQTTIDNDEVIKAYIEELSKNGFFEVLSSRLPFGVPYNTFFDRKSYEELIKN
ncbi:hypothetical protein A2572_03275 [Candidatus Collierbacteria bacterium RIFOXYD1_FULL_40_9]|uniref:Uncharacterized protein n=1 Tax=Candidatus Collierbacteria bacterium RIFOXYD1_FULL_40_9 TaxID=1817731 RepID=A0A1F5FWW9_9BACT|nr:MAG: hypothetical protein A2572_03275 [Candidatus Collierbacteria bacterium RIFOXYD1_FULL_40_9]